MPNYDGRASCLAYCDVDCGIDRCARMLIDCRLSGEKLAAGSSLAIVRFQTVSRDRPRAIPTMLTLEILEAIILGIIQGIAEFLPISSSGHLVIFGDLLERWLKIPQSDESRMQLNVALHMGTLFSIIAVYYKELFAVLKQPKVCKAIILATIPTATIGFLLKDFFEQAFHTPIVAGCSLLVTAALLMIAHRWEKSKDVDQEAVDTEATNVDGDISVRSALAIGFFQTLALVPGISRSGSTISGGLLTGLQRDTAAKFSFFIAIPVIGGATLLEVLKIAGGTTNGNPVSVLVIGALTSFVVGYFALNWLIKLISKRKLHYFAYYCVAVAILTISWQLVEGGNSEAPPVAKSPNESTSLR